MEIQPIRATTEKIPVIIPETIMVFAPHPDDELLSCGGTILKYQALGSKIIVVIATTGAGGYAQEEEKQRIIEKRKKELETVEKLLQVEILEMGLDEVVVNRGNVSYITNLLRKHQPDVIFLPHPEDVHRTHRKLSAIIQEGIYHATTGKAYGGHKKEYMPLAVFLYESPSYKFQYSANEVFIYVDITDQWEKKMEIFEKAYATQKAMLSRVVKWAEATAILRGYEVDTEKAESFIPYIEYVPLRLLLL